MELELKMKISSVSILEDLLCSKRFKVIFKVESRTDQTYYYDIAIKNSPSDFLLKKYKNFFVDEGIFSELLDVYLSKSFIKDDLEGTLIEFLKDKDSLYFTDFSNIAAQLNEFFFCYFNETFIKNYKEFNLRFSKFSLNVLQSLESDLHFRFKILKEDKVLVSSEGIFNSEQDAKIVGEKVYKEIIVYDMFRR